MIFTDKERDRLTECFLELQKQVTDMMRGSKSTMGLAILAYRASEYHKKTEEEKQELLNNLLCATPVLDTTEKVADALFFLMSEEQLRAHLQTKLIILKPRIRDMQSPVLSYLEERQRFADFGNRIDNEHYLAPFIADHLTPHEAPSGKLNVSERLMSNWPYYQREALVVITSQPECREFNAIGVLELLPGRNYNVTYNYCPNPMLGVEAKKKPEYAVKPQKKTELLHRNKKKQKPSSLLSKLVGKAV